MIVLIHSFKMELIKKEVKKKVMDDRLRGSNICLIRVPKE